MTTDLRDKTVEELREHHRPQTSKGGYWHSDDFVAVESYDELARRLTEAQRQIAEKDAALVECLRHINTIEHYSPAELQRTEKFLSTLHATAKHNAEIIRAAEEQEHKHMLRHKSWLQDDDKTFEDARKVYEIACLRTVEAVRAKKGEKR